MVKMIEGVVETEKYIWKFAKITKATLDIKDRGALTFWINVKYEDGLNQGLGGIVLDEFDKELDRRVGTAYGCEMIRRLLLNLNVNDFSEMINQHVWVIGEGKGLSFSPKGITGLSVDGCKEPLIFDDVAREFGLDV